MRSTTPTSRSFERARSTARSSIRPDGLPGVDLGGLAGKRIAALGGGTGLGMTLRGLKHLVGPEGLADLVGIVTVTDDGGSSGRLRRDYGVLPPGDIRNCLVALADDEDLLARLFQYRFPFGDGLTGHSFGNLFLTALAGITGDFYQAVMTAESVLSVRGRILPATLSDVQLRARGRSSGRLYRGEVAVGRSGEALSGLELTPAEPEAFPAAVDAIERADLVLLGPGSLYTSILPNLLIPGIRRALERTRAPRVLVLNLMTQPGETDDMNATDHVDALAREAGEGLVDRVLVNARHPGPERLDVYAEQGSVPVGFDPEAIVARGIEPVAADLLADGDLIRHDPLRLARAVADLMVGADRREPVAAEAAR